MTIFQFAWLQLDISPCFYQSNSVIALILLCLAAPFFIAPSCFCLAFCFNNCITKVGCNCIYVSRSRFGHNVPLTLFLHSCTILFHHSLKHMWSQDVISCFYALDVVDLFPVFWRILLQCYLSRCIFYGSHSFPCRSLLLSTAVLNDYYIICIQCQ